jgi:hypothetical protein
MTLLLILRDALARLVRVEEAIEDGDHSLAWELLRDLEQDVATTLAIYERQT